MVGPTTDYNMYSVLTQEQELLQKRQGGGDILCQFVPPLSHNPPFFLFLNLCFHSLYCTELTRDNQLYRVKIAWCRNFETAQSC